MTEQIRLQDFNLIIINSSAGKDSLCCLFEISRMAREQSYPMDRIIVSHQDLGEMEWPGTKALAKKQADLFGFDFFVSKRTAHDNEDLLEYAVRHGKWPGNGARWCTSDLKRDPGAKIVRRESTAREAQNVLHVFGFRREESPARAKKERLSINKRLTTKSGSRVVMDYCPILDWSTEDVWNVIRSNELPYHYAYDLGMPRLSCVFCVFAPLDALVIAGRANPELLDRYIAAEEKMQHSFRDGFSIKEVKEAIESNYKSKHVHSWAA